MEIYIIFFVASIAAGLINALAGGGGLITLPLLMLVVPPVTADATSAVALFFAYPTAVWRTRGQLSGLFGHAWLWLLLVPSLLGGLLGALLLSRTGNRNFIELVPWLVLLGTVIIALRPILVRYRDGHSIQPSFAPAWWLVAIAGIFAVALYGGYFGAGIGILMLAALSILGLTDIHQMNGLKNFLVVCINLVAAVYFIVSGRVEWAYALVMVVGAIAGGYGGAGLARKLGRSFVRIAVIVIGFGMAVSLLFRD